MFFKPTITLLLLLVSQVLSAQLSVSGQVTNNKGIPIVGANVYLEGTYDGGTTDELGKFHFATKETGLKNLVISYLSFEHKTIVLEVSQMANLEIQLKDDVDVLDTVVLSAGTFSAGDNSKVTVLKPLDVYTTASALGDFVGALQTLPGTTTVAEDGRLFVRGGEAEETQIFVDGIRVFTPYTPSTNNTPTRGRYSPILFDGITFSTGGYSAEYGQALSSVLLLNTTNEPTQEKTDIAIMTVGLGLGNTQKWDKSSLSINTSYINLAPYNGIFKDRNDWIKPYETASGEAVYRRRFENGLLKLYTAFDATQVELIQEDINEPSGANFGLQNKNLYFNGSYQGMLNDTWSMFGGFSFTNANNDFKFMDNKIEDTENSFHAKLRFKRRFNSRFKLYFGAEYFATQFDESYSDLEISKQEYGYKNNISAAFAESDLFFSKKLALKAGLRAEYSELFKEFTLSPRLSLAYKTSEKGQVSLAYGDFYQNSSSNILKFEQDLKAENTSHYILNYQYNKEGKIFRAETFYKNYKNLVKYDGEFTGFDSDYNNNGYGFAKGVDVFWRDSKSIRNIDYWLSYSYLDTQRDYRNYPTKSQPNFANKHNVSIVGKYWIDDWKSQVGLSVGFASGRTYTNPNAPGFLNQKTKAYNSLSLNWAYLVNQQMILYFSMNNALGTQNIHGYQYANTPDVNNHFDRRALRPAADQFFFVGFFWTISDDGIDNQLDKL
jgi:outer membrane cobalamin receptor